jgi:hypothetical protein
MFARRGESVHALRSHMSVLEFLTEPRINCHDSDVGDVAFVKAAGAIRGRDSVEEYMACVLYSLSTGVILEEVAGGITPTSKLKVALSKFCAVCSDEEDDVKFLVRVEL